MPNPFRMLTLSGFLLVTVLGISNAHAIIFVNGTGACLDVRYGNTANLTPVQAYPCHADFPQQWNFAGLFIHGIFIHGIGTSSAGNKCLDVAGGRTEDNTLVQLFQCNGTGAQRWYYLDGQIINTNSGRCLDILNGATWTQARIRGCNGSAGQKWYLRS